MLEMVFLISLPPRRQTCCSPRPDGVSSSLRIFSQKRRLIDIDLVEYCVRENVPFTVFHDFSEIHKIVADVVEGKISVQQAATGTK
jgi:hypothetical protein